MDKINLPTIDLVKINSYTNERDLKIWNQQAVAKYTKCKYQEFRKENEILDKEIADNEEKFNKIQRKMPTTKAVIEKLVNSITIGSDVIDHLTQERSYIEREIIQWKEKYEKLIAQYIKVDEDKKETLGKTNPLCKEIIELNRKVKKMQIQDKILNQAIKDQERIIKIKTELNKKILNINIIKFVESFVNAEKLEAINKEFEEKRILAQNLLKKYENQKQCKGYIEYQNATKKTEIPKLLLQRKSQNNLCEINVPTVTSSLLKAYTKEIEMPNVNEIDLLSNLKKRSVKRQKIIWKMQNSNLLKAKEPQNSFVGQPASASSVLLDGNKENIKQISPNKESSKELLKVNILQNELITGNSLEENIANTLKRVSNDNMKNVVEKKKFKRVSFVNCVPQKESENNIKTDTIIQENIENGISSYFSNAGNDNMTTFLPEKSLCLEKAQPSTGFNFENSTLGFIAQDLKELTSDESFFFKTQDDTFNGDQNENFSNNFFSWSRPNSQQNTSFGNNFNLF